MNIHKQAILLATIFTILFASSVNAQTDMQIPFTLALVDNAPESDVQLGVDLMAELQEDGYTFQDSAVGKLFKDVNALDLDNRVTLAISQGRSVIILGLHSSTNHVTFAVNLQAKLSEHGVLTGKTILSDQLETSDLNDLFTNFETSNAVFCSDSDKGKDYFVKGKTTDNKGTSTDYCKDEYLIEYYCEIERSEVKQYCEYGCNAGACIKSLKTPDFTIAISESGPSSDVTLGINILASVQNKGYQIPNSQVSILFKQVDATAIDEEVVLAIYQGKAKIIYSDESLKKYSDFIRELSNTLDNKGITYNVILTNELVSSNLEILFEPTKTADQEITGCSQNSDCPIISCDESTKLEGICNNRKCAPQKCPTKEAMTEETSPPVEIQKEDIAETKVEEKNTPTCEGCLKDENCLPYGTRLSSEYCKIDGNIYTQKESKMVCDNNYECQSNLCIDSKCVEPGIFDKFIRWLSKIFG